VFPIGAVVPSVQHHPFAVRHHPLDSVEPLAPRLCFAGSADEIDEGERWSCVRVRLARPLLERRPELERYGWDVGDFALGCYGWFAQGLLLGTPLAIPLAAGFGLNTMPRNEIRAGGTDGRQGES
jgi:hypothetical protein